jgi:hypothetical protein
MKYTSHTFLGLRSVRNCPDLWEDWSVDDANPAKSSADLTPAERSVVGDRLLLKEFSADKVARRINQSIQAWSGSDYPDSPKMKAAGNMFVQCSCP